MQGVLGQTVKDAIDLGYRYLDTAPNGNEEEVGDAIYTKIMDGTVKRCVLKSVNEVNKRFNRRNLHYCDSVCILYF